MSTVWDDAIVEALGAVSPERPATLFYESREDLTLVVTPSGEPASTHTFQRGLSADAIDRDRRWVWLGDPAPEDTVRLVGSVVGGKPLSPSPAGEPPNPGSQSLNPGPGLSWLETLRREVIRDAPTATVRSRWVEFDQRIWVGRSGQRLVRDRRRGCRARIEAWLAGAATSSAVSEVVFKHPAIEGAPVQGPAPSDVARALTERLRRRLHARPAPAGERPVVLAPGIGGILVHELVGHALEADAARRGSWLSGHAGQVSPPALTVVDDPRRGRAPWRFDDEGQPSRPTPLVGAGRVRSWLHDRTSARAAGVDPSGHGRRASFREPVRPRMGCTFVAAGGLAAAEVLAGVDGVYVRRMEAASVDPHLGLATFRVSDADAITNGRIGNALQPMMLRVDARRAFASIDRIGDDLCFDPCVGSCQRDGQSLAISVGAPTIRIGVATVIA